MFFFIYLCEYFLCKITMNKRAILSILSNREIVFMLSAHGELSPKLFTSGNQFPLFLAYLSRRLK